MGISDQWVEHLLLTDNIGVHGLLYSQDDDRLNIYYGGGGADYPGHSPHGDTEWVFSLEDAPMDYYPPENFEHEKVEGESYDYGFAISDASMRAMLSDDPIVGVWMFWDCPREEPDCDGGDETVWMAFQVDEDADGGEDYTEKAPKEIDGYPVSYS